MMPAQEMPGERITHSSQTFGSAIDRWRVGGEQPGPARGAAAGDGGGVAAGQRRLRVGVHLAEQARPDFAPLRLAQAPLGPQQPRQHDPGDVRPGQPRAGQQVGNGPRLPRHAEELKFLRPGCRRLHRVDAVDEALRPGADFRRQARDHGRDGAADFHAPQCRVEPDAERADQFGHSARRRSGAAAPFGRAAGARGRRRGRPRDRRRCPPR